MYSPTSARLRFLIFDALGVPPASVSSSDQSFPVLRCKVAIVGHLAMRAQAVYRTVVIRGPRASIAARS